MTESGSRPGASPGSNTSTTAKARLAPPTARANRSPCRHIFSIAMTAASPTIAATFITPNAIIRTINAQQHPRQNHPWARSGLEVAERPAEAERAHQVPER
jgi:hypothetical protein